MTGDAFASVRLHSSAYLMLPSEEQRRVMYAVVDSVVSCFRAELLFAVQFATPKQQARLVARVNGALALHGEQP